MDLGVAGSDGLASSSSGFCYSDSDPDTKQKLYGPALFQNQERSDNDVDGSWKSSKFARTDDDLSASNKKPISKLRSNSSSTNSAGCPQQQHRTLSFSCSKSHDLNTTLSNFHLSSASPYSRNTSYHIRLNNGFTPSQWTELEHQALIYKYISSNMPIPSHLLLPIRKAFESVWFSGLSGGVLGSNALRLGAVNLGFTNRSDTEQGRCRRTDGKKWRCSRDAVADQKYCERHMNRGRHRSRKPVEGQQVPGQSSATATTSSAAAGSSTAAALEPTCGSGSS